MYKLKNKVATTFVIAICFQLFVFGQTSNPIEIDSVTVQQVLDKYHKAVGGIDKVKSIKSRLIKSSTQMKMKMSGNTTTTLSKMVQLLTLDGKNVTLVGDEKDMISKVYFDGEDGYTYIKTLNSKTPFDESTKQRFKKIAGLGLKGLNANTYLPKVKLDSVNKKQCYVIESMTELGDGTFTKSTQYFATDTGLLYLMLSKTPQASTKTFVLDYKDIDGYLNSMSSLMINKTELATTIFTSIYEEINYNGYIDSYFTKDDAASAQQVKAVYISKGKHQELLNKYSSLTGGSTDVSDIVSNDGKNTTKTVYGSNLRDIAYKSILESKKGGTVNVSNSNNTLKTTGKRTDVEDLEEEYKDFKDLKYRRSSLYTMMINEPSRERNNVIRNAFGNTELSQKFNDHNIGPYLIPGKGGEKDQTAKIEEYLNAKGVAKELVAKWFNRDADGNFNMDLVAKRGQYNASDLNVQIANSSKRGAAILKDAGEELIGNTFVIVYDYKYTNKQEQAKKRKGVFNFIKTAASLVGADDIANITDVVTVASDVVGKGYFVRTTTYLYQLVWDDETANTFYQDMWIDKDNPDAGKKAAFDRSNLFKLKYVGSEISRNNLQSTIFTSKSNDELIQIATTRAVDKNIGKLQRTFEEFRVKTPLLSGDPLAAKIGTKEGIEKGDKFEVLEQLIDEDGLTSYKRVGTIKVDPKNIWDNGYLAKEQTVAETDAKNNPKANKKKKGMFTKVGVFGGKKKKKKEKIVITSKKEKTKEEKPEYTIFTGKKGKFASGMLIRQIN